MSYDQLYVTSCRRGVTGSAGFQTLAMSPGIQQAERVQIEGLVGYVKPSGSPEDPTPEQLDACFPVNFGHAILASGRWCLFQSVYAGLDHNERHGNYFAHAIVGEPGTLPELPHRYWRSPTLVRSARETEERVASTGDYSLAVLDAVARPPDEPLTTWADQIPPPLLADMVAAACCSRTNGRRVVLAASPEQAIQCYARLAGELPPRWAREISFCTYARDPIGLKTHLHLAAVQPGQGLFGFTDMDRDYTSCVFDFERRSFSRVPELGWQRSPALDALAEDAALPQSESEVRGALAFASMESGAAPEGTAAREAAAYLITRHREGRMSALRARWLSAGGLANGVGAADAPAHLEAMLMMAEAEGGSPAWEDAGEMARRVFRRLLFVERKDWQEALAAALRAGGDAQKFAGLLLRDDFLTEIQGFVGEAKTDAAASACSFLIRVFAESSAAAADPPDERLVETVWQALPSLRQATGKLSELMSGAPAAFQAALLARLLRGKEEGLAWLAAEMSACWGAEPTAEFAALALPSHEMLSAPSFATFFCQVAALELSGDGAPERYKRIVNLLKQHPSRLQRALVQPRLFTMATAATPDRIPEMCRDYLRSSPEAGADLTPVLDLLERNVSLANPPKWLAGRTLEKLWDQRRAFPPKDIHAPALSCLRARQLLAGKTPVSEVQRQHPHIHAEMASLPNDAWEGVAATCARRFARRRAEAAEYAAFLRMLGGASPARMAQTVWWMAKSQLPGLLRRGNLPGLLALVEAVVDHPWPGESSLASRKALSGVLEGARESTLKELRGQSHAGPAVHGFLKGLPRSRSWLVTLMHRLAGR